MVDRRPLFALLVLLAAPACTAAVAPWCPTPDAEFTDGVPCSRAGAAFDLIEVLVARRPASAERNAVLAEIAGHADPSAEVAAIEALLAEVRATTGFAGATSRSRLLFDLLEEKGKAPLSRTSHPAWFGALDRLAAVRGKDAASRLVLTEMDIEAWIAYVSLCREVQAGQPLKLSITQREALYRRLAERFRTGTPDEQEALVSLGSHWPDFATSWREASYERQQAWITRAPLPQPLDATALAYAENFLDSGPLRPHAETWHTAFPDLRMGGYP